MAHWATEGKRVGLPPGMMHPSAADDTAAALTDVEVAEPVNGTIEIAGPEPIRMDEFVRQFLSATGDARKVNTDVHARYFGAELNDQSLVPGPRAKPRLGATRFVDSLSRSTS